MIGSAVLSIVLGLLGIILLATLYSEPGVERGAPVYILDTATFYAINAVLLFLPWLLSKRISWINEALHMC